MNKPTWQWFPCSQGKLGWCSTKAVVITPGYLPCTSQKCGISLLLRVCSPAAEEKSVLVLTGGPVRTPSYSSSGGKAVLCEAD